jgi:hypothetical protein
MPQLRGNEPILRLNSMTLEQYNKRSNTPTSAQPLGAHP